MAECDDKVPADFLDAANDVIGQHCRMCRGNVKLLRPPRAAAKEPLQ